jgi:hypothetical protein
VLHLVTYISPPSCDEASCSLKDGYMVISVAEIVSTAEKGRSDQPFWRG